MKTIEAKDILTTEVNTDGFTHIAKDGCGGVYLFNGEPEKSFWEWSGGKHDFLIDSDSRRAKETLNPEILNTHYPEAVWLIK